MRTWRSQIRRRIASEERIVRGMLFEETWMMCGIFHARVPVLGVPETSVAYFAVLARLLSGTLDSPLVPSAPPGRARLVFMVLLLLYLLYTT